MAQPQLRVYFGPDAGKATVPPGNATATTVTVPLGEVLPLLVDAVESHRAWLADFEDDEISISTDLYEVLVAYRHFRPSA